MKLATLLLAVSAWAQVPIGTSSGSSSGGGATSLSSVTDFALTRTPTVMTINAAATTSAPVNGRVGSTNYQFTGAGTVTLSGTACSATQYWYIAAASGVITMGHNASTCTYTGSGVTVATPISGYPADSMPLWTTSTTSGAWDTLTGTMDKRAPNSVGRTITGSGCIVATTGATSTDLDGSACGALPAGSGSELQIRSSASAFGVVTGSSYNPTGGIGSAPLLTANAEIKAGANNRVYLFENSSSGYMQLNSLSGGDMQIFAGAAFNTSYPALHFGISTPSVIIPRSGGIQILAGLDAVKPACGVTFAGMIYFTVGVGGVASTVEMCGKNAGGIFAYVALGTWP